MVSVHERFMAEAFKLAQQAYQKGEVPVGAVITHKKQIIAKAYNQVEQLKDPTAHAEMIAITQACNSLSQKWLLDCTMYVTVEPCAMCAGALVLARIKNVMYAAADPKAGACGSVLNIAQHAQLNHKITVEKGPLSKECGAIMTRFFEERRNRKQE